jgi:hypothetical protein
MRIVARTCVVVATSLLGTAAFGDPVSIKIASDDPSEIRITIDTDAARLPLEEVNLDGRILRGYVNFSANAG